MWDQLKKFLYVVSLAIIFVGCGQGNKEDVFKRGIGITVPLASTVDCSQAAAQGQIGQVLQNGTCVIFDGRTSIPMNFPFPLNEIQTIQLEAMDPSGNKHIIGQLNQSINTVQSGGFVFLTDIQTNQPVCRLTLQGNSQALVEIDLTGSQTMAQLYQTLFQSQTTLQMQLVFTKKQD